MGYDYYRGKVDPDGIYHFSLGCCTVRGTYLCLQCGRLPQQHGRTHPHACRVTDRRSALGYTYSKEPDKCFTLALDESFED